jgi:hypothetical protein
MSSLTPTLPGSRLLLVACAPQLQRTELRLLAETLGWPTPSDAVHARERRTWGRKVRWARPMRTSGNLARYPLRPHNLFGLEEAGMVSGLIDSAQAQFFGGRGASTAAGILGRAAQWAVGDSGIKRERIAFSITPLGQACVRLRLECVRQLLPENWPDDMDPLALLAQRAPEVDLVARALDWPSVALMAQGDGVGTVRWTNPSRARHLLYGESEAWNRLCRQGWAVQTRRRADGHGLNRWEPTDHGRAMTRLYLLAVQLERQLAEHEARAAR